MSRLTIKTELLTRLSKNTTTSFYTDTMLENWINRANKWGCGYKPWPFTEYMDKSLAFVSGTELYSYPNSTFKTDSIRVLKIGSNTLWSQNPEFIKTSIKSYMKYREDYPVGTDKIFSDFQRQLYINPNCVSGSVYSFAQLVPADIPLGDGGDSETSPFEGGEDEGVEAIIERVLSYASEKERKLTDSINHFKIAISILDGIWDRTKDEMSGYQDKNTPLFERFDVLKGTYRSDINNPLQF